MAGLSIVAAVVIGTAGTAGAQSGDDNYAGPPSSVQSATTVLTPADADNASAVASEEVQVAGASVEGTSLAFTGGDTLALVGIGLGAILVGGLVVITRSRANASA